MPSNNTSSLVGRWDRANFYSTYIDIQGKVLLDYLTFAWLGFKNYVTQNFPNEVTIHTITDVDANRLDIVSYVYYDTVDLWWLLALFNGILVPYVIPTGFQLNIPSITAVNSYYNLISKNSSGPTGNVNSLPIITSP